MLRPRIIPCLLLDGDGLYKTIRFKNPKYVGDPINAVRIFNDKEVDELIILDFTATKEGRKPNFSLLAEIASECFMPLCYGGGIRSLDDIGKLFRLGVEKVAINSCSHESPKLISEAANTFGSQSIVASIDVKRGLLGRYETYRCRATVACKKDPADWAAALEELGAGEIFLTSIDREGTKKGFDRDLIRRVAARVQVPVIANGGAGTISDLASALEDGGASAASAGTLFVLHGRHRAVLISYPRSEVIEHLHEFKDTNVRGAA